jgi:3-mercaptopyruvate sulfurtransferase SseA
MNTTQITESFTQPLDVAPGVGIERPARQRTTLSALAALAMTMAMAALAPAQAQERVDVAQAQQALARGAVAWDLRAAGAVLPGAARIAPQALQAWLMQADTAALSQAVSAVGLNLSAEVLLVADDDATAQAVAERLRPLARGRLAWLAGGAAAWQSAGLPLEAAPTQRLPMPQRLTPAAPAQDDKLQATGLADAARRATVTLSVVLQEQTAANNVLQRR